MRAPNAHEPKRNCIHAHKCVKDYSWPDQLGKEDKLDYRQPNVRSVELVSAEIITSSQVHVQRTSASDSRVRSSTHAASERNESERKQELRH